jgi:two-component system OmpR family response regulator
MARVLVVDDEPTVREVLAVHLATLGHAADTAEDGARALDLARRTRPDVVLIDIMMPGMNGIETLRRLRALLPKAGFVMISGADDQNLAIRALELGAFDYLRKPFDLDYLERILKVRLATSF